MKASNSGISLLNRKNMLAHAEMRLENKNNHKWKDLVTKDTEHESSLS